MEVTQADVDRVFPHGVIAFYEIPGKEHTRLLVDVRLAQTEDARVIAVGWTPPYKDMYFDLTDVQEMAPDRWRLKDWDGNVSVIFNPMRADQEDAVRKTMYGS